jgi:hypothetical protein
VAVGYANDEVSTARNFPNCRSRRTVERPRRAVKEKDEGCRMNDELQKVSPVSESVRFDATLSGAS